MLRRVTDPFVRLARGPVSSLLGSTATEEGTLPDHPVFRPHATNPTYAWTHYGVMIPDLPAPHHFMSFMSLIGATGSLVFDTDHARTSRPRDTATLINATAATAPGHFRAYSIRRDCHFADDGSEVRFGDDAVLTGTFPRFRLQGTRPGFRYDLRLACSDAVTYFLRGPIWEHLSILARYSGTIGDLAVSGSCTFEYGASRLSAHLLADLPLPAQLKLAGDRFNYNVLALAPGRQLLLSSVGIAGRPLVEAAYVRDEHAGSLRRTTKGVHCTIVEAQDEPAVAPDGRKMVLPRRLRWDGPGVAVEGTIDTPMVYGLGSGYVGGYAYTGELDGEAIAGRAYIEYIDRTRG